LESNFYQYQGWIIFFPSCAGQFLTADKHWKHHLQYSYRKLLDKCNLGMKQLLHFWLGNVSQLAILFCQALSPISHKNNGDRFFFSFLETRIISSRMVILNRFCTLVCYLNLAASELTWLLGPHGRPGMENFCTPSKLQGSITLLEIQRIIFVGVNHRQWDFLPIGGHELPKESFVISLTIIMLKGFKHVIYFK